MAIALSAAPALAQGSARTFAMPQGCAAYVTMHKRGCLVSHLFRCEADPEGHQRRVDLDEAGLTYMGMIDSETQWIESYYPLSGETARLLPGATDPASFTELLETGRDGMDFETMSDIDGVTSFRGEDRLTGNTMVVDGITLEETEFEVTAFDPAGQFLWTVRGNEYIQRDWRTFLSGTRTYDNGTESWDLDNTPVEFIFPGEPGFLTSTPRHGCGAIMSKIDISLPEGMQ
jgi:hypothetical protein